MSDDDDDIVDIAVPVHQRNSILESVRPTSIIPSKSQSNMRLESEIVRPAGHTQPSTKTDAENRTDNQSHPDARNGPLPSQQQQQQQQEQQQQQTSQEPTSHAHQQQDHKPSGGTDAAHGAQGAPGAEDITSKGMSLIKYGRWGKPHLRRFWTDAQRIHWESPKKDPLESSVAFSEVTSILVGRKTEVFKRFKADDQEHLSFSLVYGGKKASTLDVVCRNKEEFETWLDALGRLTGKSPQQ